MRIHKLKIKPTYFLDIVHCMSRFEIRYNYRYRNYEVGDYLLLQEFNGDYTGREILVRVGYILRDFAGLRKGYVAMNIERIKITGII